MLWARSQLIQTGSSCAGDTAAAGGPLRPGCAAFAAAPWLPASLWTSDPSSTKPAAEDGGHTHGTSQVVLEGDLVNLDVASPAATLALGLIFMRSGDPAAAAVLQLPETAHTLDFVRPMQILLRVTARALILWDTIEPSEAWVYAQLPPVLRRKWGECVAPMRQAAEEESAFDWEAVLLGHLHGVAGAALALGLRFAGAAVACARPS